MRDIISLFNKTILFIKKENVLKYLKNTSWQVGDKIIRMIVSLLVNVFVNRYLGPENYGILNYIASLLTLFFSFCNLGLDEILIKELVNKKDQLRILIGTSFYLRLFSSIISFILVVISFFIFKNEENIKLYIVLMALPMILQSYSIVDLYFQSEVKSHISIKVSLVSLFIGSILRLFFVYFQLPLIFYIYIGILETVISISGLIYSFNKVTNISFFKLKYNYKIAKELLSESWPLIFASIVVLLYMRIDQIMIKEMLNFKELGVFSSSLRIIELWYFIPMTIGASLFPALINAKSISNELFEKRLQILFNVMILISVVISIFVSFFSDIIILFLYGRDFIEASNVLKIQIWSSVFVFIGVASSKWFIINGHTKLSLVRTLYGVVINICLNFLLIPKYGIIGAAISTLITQFFVSFLSDIINKHTRQLFYMKCKAFNLFSSIKSLKSIKDVI